MRAAHSRTAPSNEPDASSCASGEKATQLTSCTWPVSRATAFFDAAGAHRKSVKSSEPEASSSPPPRSRSSAYRFAAAAAAAAASAGAAPRWSCAPVRSAASVESARQFTQWPWPSRVRTSFPSAAAHTLTVRSCEPVKRRPSPPHRTLDTESACPDSVSTGRPVARSHSRTVPSLDADAKRPHAPAASPRWSGSHASALMNFLCARIVRCGAAKSDVAHTATAPSLPPESR